MASSSLSDAAPARRANSRQRRAAFHEAGRALAFLYAGHPFTAASVWPVAEGYAGRMEGASAVHGGFIGAARLSAELEIVAVLAGPLAEARAARHSLGAIVLTDGNHDWHRAHDLAATWFPAAPSAALALAEERARALVSSRQGWRTIEALAARLIATGRVEWAEAAAAFAEAYAAEVPSFAAWVAHWPLPVAAIRAGRLPT
jgi:hypothetical protein